MKYYYTMDRIDVIMEYKCLIKSYFTAHNILSTTDRMDGTMESKCLSKFTAHPVLLYHGLDGHYNGIQSIHIYLILLHIPSYCTMDSLDSIMESKCPSCPIIPQTGWTVQWKTSVYLHLCTLSYYPTCPIVLWTGWTVR